MNAVKWMNRTFVFVTAPVIGLFIWMIATSFQFDLQDDLNPKHTITESSQQREELSVKANEQLSENVDLANETLQYIDDYYELYEKMNNEIAAVAKLIATSKQIPLSIYDKKITTRLGKPSATIDSKNLRAQLFYINHDEFQSYVVKIKLKSKDSMKMVMGGDKLGETMTTLTAAKTYGGAVAINAGGFADARGNRYPLGTTVMDGEYIQGFQPSQSDLFFVGMNANNKLIGGKFNKKAQLDKLKPKFGATFVPVLLKNGASQTIPDKWKTNPARAPRTIIANYKDDQLLLMVTDGYNTNGSKGATLAELQTILKGYGAVDAYNLDGGGSSSLIFNGNIINKPSDGSLRQLPTHFLFLK